MKKVTILLKETGQAIKKVECVPIISKFKKLLKTSNLVYNPLFFNDIAIYLGYDSGQKKEFNCKIKNVDFYGNLIFVAENFCGYLTSLTKEQEQEVINAMKAYAVSP